jgi:hypothetical protein
MPEAHDPRRSQTVSSFIPKHTPASACNVKLIIHRIKNTSRRGKKRLGCLERLAG